MLYSKMVKNELFELKSNLKLLYEISQELHSIILKEVRVMKYRRNWQYATYQYIKGISYERKSRYKKLYYTVCEVENIINNYLV